MGYNVAAAARKLCRIAPRSAGRPHCGTWLNPDRPDPIVGENSAGGNPSRHNKVGILSFILSEAGFFAALILAYLYFYARPQGGPGPKELDVPRTLVFSVCLSRAVSLFGDPRLP